MKERFLLEIKKHIWILVLGFTYFMWIIIFNTYIPCVFNKITGLYCPGCGISHMIMALFRFDFKEAFSYNSFLFIVLPLILINYLIYKIRYVITGIKKDGGIKVKIFEYAVLVATVVFWILRNIPIILRIIQT